MGINTTNISPNSTHIPSMTHSSHCKFIESVELEMSEEDKNLSYLYWTPKLHKVPFKHCFIAGSSKCTTKDLSYLLTKVLTTVKDELIRHNNTKTSCDGVNSMWIVKKLHKPVFIRGPTGCPYSNISSDTTFPPCTHQSHAISLISNYCTSTQLIQEKKWK